MMQEQKIELTDKTLTELIEERYMLMSYDERFALENKNQNRNNVNIAQSNGCIWDVYAKIDGDAVTA